jgi:hypothetical protein
VGHGVGAGVPGPRGTRPLLLCGWAPSGRVTSAATRRERVPGPLPPHRTPPTGPSPVLSPVHRHRASRSTRASTLDRKVRIGRRDWSPLRSWIRGC